MAVSQQCAVIDYGMGNLHSAHGALQAVSPNTHVVVTSDPDTIKASDHVVLPGVGAIRDCVAEMRRVGVDQIIAEAIKTKPVLGICVGLQALLEHSEENGGVDALGLFKGVVRQFPNHMQDEHGEPLKVPHMGWNRVRQENHPLWNNIADNSRFYFVHSYFVEAAHERDIKGRGHYGVPFAAALGCDNLFAVQFHPEKSHTAGLELLKNFLSWDGQS